MALQHPQHQLQQQHSSTSSCTDPGGEVQYSSASSSTIRGGEVQRAWAAFLLTPEADRERTIALRAAVVSRRACLVEAAAALTAHNREMAATKQKMEGEGSGQSTGAVNGAERAETAAAADADAAAAAASGGGGNGSEGDAALSSGTPAAATSLTPTLVEAWEAAKLALEGAELDLRSALKASVTAFEAWFAAKTGGRLPGSAAAGTTSSNSSASSTSTNSDGNAQQHWVGGDDTAATFYVAAAGSHATSDSGRSRRRSSVAVAEGLDWTLLQSARGHDEALDETEAYLKMEVRERGVEFD